MEIIIGIVAFLVGGALVYVLLRIHKNGMLVKASEEAELIKKNKLLEVKEKYLQLKQQYEEVVRTHDQKNQQTVQRLRQQEQELNMRQANLQKAQNTLQQNQQLVEQQRVALSQQTEEVEHLRGEIQQKLEDVSGYSAQTAKKELVDSLQAEAKTAAMAYVNEVMDEAKLTAMKQSQKIIIQSIQRIASETAVENAVSVFHIDNDEVKGRIIGREGRNIRTLEACTGVEIIIDDTPECITLSAFDPVRREVARLALHALVQDGRIHPGRIEEVVEKVRKQLEEEINEVGKRTAIDMGVHGLHPELIRLVGRMKYRSSYGQNLLMHARETANLCASMAAELGIDARMARRAGLLHDIGKVFEEDIEMPHALVGKMLCEKYGEKPEICNAVGAHHDEIEMETLIAPLVQACDAISGARPGARREIVETYIKRLKNLESLALSYPGVKKTYALQAGRELRVIVAADKVSDTDVQQLSTDLASKIQSELTYPGQIRITVIRETRSIALAK